jgi:hypothetical protein
MLCICLMLSFMGMYLLITIIDHVMIVVGVFISYY